MNGLPFSQRRGGEGSVRCLGLLRAYAALETAKRPLDGGGQ